MWRTGVFTHRPIGCPSCGPSVKVLFSDGSELGFGHGFDTPAAQVAWVLADGLIVALLGVGGFQLLADASSEAAVRRLRRLKERDAKPFAVMVPDVAAAERLCRLSEEESACWLLRPPPLCWPGEGRMWIWLLPCACSAVLWG